MKRLAVITVGKTHSGKTSFAKRMFGSVVIDQDFQAEFLHTYYQKLLPNQGPNKIKNTVTKMIVEYAVDETGCHLILSNSNRNYEDRKRLLDYFISKGLTTILVHFDLPDAILKERIATSQRNTAIIRTASSFEQVLVQQQAADGKGTIVMPAADEADHVFAITTEEEIGSIIRRIIDVSHD